MSNNKPHNLPYRPCVGIALINEDNKLFVGERIDNPGAWQMPQGGVDKGEDIEEAFYREMLEEIGTDKADIIKIHNKPLRYDLPPHLLGKLWNGKYGGQEQIWVAAKFTGSEEDINIKAYRYPEFRKWQWAKAQEMLNLIVPFKKETYKEIISFLEDNNIL